MKESDLYGPVKEWLQSKGYDVYPEVTCNWRRVDVVGVRHDRSIAIELKTSLNLDLIHQCRVVSFYANEVYAAIPKPSRTLKHRDELLGTGIGLLYVSEGVTVDTSPIVREVRQNIAEKVFAEYCSQGIQGGHAGGGYLTPFKIVVGRAKEFIESQPHPVTMRQIMDHVGDYKGHYSDLKSAESAIRGHLMLSEIKYWRDNGRAPDWVKVIRQGGRVFFAKAERVAAHG